MSHYPTTPVLFDESPYLSIAHLKQWGHLQPGVNSYQENYWNHQDFTKRWRVCIFTSLTGVQPYVQLMYSYNGQQISYIVPLVSRLSNLGKGRVWYFKCPRTGKLCRKLYWIGKFFAHREAFKGAVYLKQTQSKKAYQQAKELFEREEILDIINKKYRKKHYRNQYTREYMALIKKLRGCG